MKTIQIASCWILLTASGLRSEVPEMALDVADSIVYSDYEIPLTEEEDAAIRLSLERLGCPLAEFLKMNGVPFTSKATSVLDSDSNILRLHSSHKTATFAVMLMGKIMFDMVSDSLTPQQIAARYPHPDDSPFSEPRTNQNKKQNKPEMATPRKPSD